MLCQHVHNIQKVPTGYLIFHFFCLTYSMKYEIGNTNAIVAIIDFMNYMNYHSFPTKADKIGFLGTNQLIHVPEE